MGTRGYIIYRYKGRYYAKYNQFDSYPNGLGKNLVDSIPKDRKRYTEWLTNLKTEYQEVEEYFFGKESTTPIEVMTIPFEEYLIVFPLGAGESGVDFQKRGLTLFPSIWPPPNTLLIEWTYTIDLDRELFSVDHEVHFRLSAIPDTWITELKVIRDGADPDDDDELKLIPQAIDISYPKQAVVETYVQLYEKANCSILQVDAQFKFSLTSVYECLCFEQAKFFMKFNSNLFWSKYISTWGPEDVRFKELAFILLLLADRYSFSLTPLSPPSCEDVRGTLKGLLLEENDDEIGVACPATSSFWFAGTFVYLTAHLKDEAIRKSAIGHVLELTKDCPRSSFTAFLFSISDLVVVEFSEEGVKHTETLPFFDDTNYSVVTNVGLLAMITYLTQSRTSLANHRTRIPTSPSSLPYDILLNIIKYVDWETTVTLSATSKLLRECVERLGPKLGNFQLLKYDADSENFLARRDGDNLVKIKIQKRYTPRSDPRPYLFNVKIRYPGVKAFIPPLRVIVLSSDPVEL